MAVLHRTYGSTNEESESVVLYGAADEIAQRVIYTKDNEERLRNILGNIAFTPDGQIDRAVIRSILLRNNIRGKAARDNYNYYFGPAIWAAIQEEAKRLAREKHEACVFVENALLFEQWGKGKFPFVICVYCKTETARARILARPGWTNEDFDHINNIQLPIEKKRELSDATIDTTEKSLPETEECVRELIEKSTGFKVPKR